MLHVAIPGFMSDTAACGASEMASHDCLVDLVVTPEEVIRVSSNCRSMIRSRFG